MKPLLSGVDAGRIWPGSGRPRRNVGQRRLIRRTMVVFAAPSVILLVLLTAYPLVYGAVQSVHNGTLISTGSFVGMDNYWAALTSSAFWQAAEFTLLFTLVGVFGSWAIGLALALLLRAAFPGRNFFKMLLTLPWVVPIVVTATSWNWLIATNSSPLTLLASALGLGHPLFLASPFLAKITVCIFKVWVSFPFMMLMSSAALTGVDGTLYEAARVDGASSWQQFRRITLPLIAKPTYISWIIMTIFCVNDFPTIYLLTGGGPVSSTTSLVVLAYRTVFDNFQVGPGVSIAFIMTGALVIVSVLLYRLIRKAHA